jgi:predicted TIM-barrel fold metal-dependent hydrolase
VKIADMTLVSAADYVVEPPDLFASHFPARLADQAPRLEPGPDGTPSWVFQGTAFGGPSSAVHVVPPAPADDQPGDDQPADDQPGDDQPGDDQPGDDQQGYGYETLPPALYSAAARLRAMDANGVLAAACFPTLDMFNGARLHRLPDPALSAAVVEAYNDWQADEWAAADPARLVAVGVLPAWYLDAAVAEAVRLADKGVSAVTFPEMPYLVDLPSFSSDHWDPLLRVICDHGMALCLQLPAATSALKTSDDAPFNPFASQADLIAPQMAATACTDLIVSGVLNRFPELRVSISRGGIGWIPFLLDRVDLHQRNQSWSGLDLGGLTGTEVFRKHFLGCFVSDPSTLYLRDRIGVNAIAWESAFPLPDTTWPSSPELLLGELEAAGAGDDDINAITWRNACHFYRFDPYAALAPEDGTSGALRARAGQGTGAAAR